MYKLKNILFFSTNVSTDVLAYNMITKHGCQTAWLPDRQNITQHTVDKTRTKHGHQTDTILHDTLSTKPARSMVTRQTQHYTTHCRQDPHEAWSLDRQHTVNRTRTKHGRQTDTTLHDILSTRPAQSMVARQTQQYMIHC